MPAYAQYAESRAYICSADIPFSFFLWFFINLLCRNLMDLQYNFASFPCLFHLFRLHTHFSPRCCLPHSFALLSTRENDLLWKRVDFVGLIVAAFFYIFICKRFSLVSCAAIVDVISLSQRWAQLWRRWKRQTSFTLPLEDSYYRQSTSSTSLSCSIAHFYSFCAQEWWSECEIRACLQFSSHTKQNKKYFLILILHSVCAISQTFIGR